MRLPTQFCDSYNWMISWLCQTSHEISHNMAHFSGSYTFEFRLINKSFYISVLRQTVNGVLYNTPFTVRIGILFVGRTLDFIMAKWYVL